MDIMGRSYMFTTSRSLRVNYLPVTTSHVAFSLHFEDSCISLAGPEIFGLIYDSETCLRSRWVYKKKLFGLKKQTDSRQKWLSVQLAYLSIAVILYC